MRGLVLIVALAAGGCMHATSSSPSWPKERTDGEGGAPAAAAPAAPEDVIQTEEIVIEVGGDD